MPQIHILSPHVADMIAAGEVVERPASAVKELMENAFDAGARNIVVDIRGGGRESIRVTDDGCGMSAEDAGVCFLRHATSKLRDERGLEAIGTLGFRGEALAAIASVSRISLTTRRKGAELGTAMELTAGDIDDMRETGCAEGTTITVRDLFFNTPARQKFMGSDRSEGAACVQTALRSALGRPEVSVRCLKDGEEQFFSPGDGRMDSCAYALLGREAVQGFLSVDTERDGIGVKGFVSAPTHCRGNRTGQIFFCNGRPIRSRSLQAALEQAYKNSAMVGRFPACVLYITLPNGLVDVNVHPSKAEVKFSKEKEVFDGVYYGTLAALQGEDRLHVPVYKPAAVTTPAPAKRPEPKKDFFQSMRAEEFRAKAPQWEKKPAAPAPAAKPASVLPIRDSGLPYKAEIRRPPVAPAPPVSAPVAAPPSPVPAPPVVQQTVMEKSFETEPCRFVGEALGVYIILEQGDKLILIDKHAAHERALFDRIRLNEKPLMAQELLIPETLRCGADALALAEGEKETLQKLGFEFEAFGEDSLIIRAVPADIDPARAVPLMEELLDKLGEGRRLNVKDVWERLAETVACKAAIKAGKRSDPAELLALGEKVLNGDVRYCPHGRPVFTVLTRSELDKRFGRIV